MIQQKKTNAFKVYLTDKLLAKIAKQAKERAMSVSGFIRFAVVEQLKRK